MSEIKIIKIIKITTKEITDSVIACYSDMLRMAVLEGEVLRLNDICNDYRDALQLLGCTDNMPGIRKLFKDGNSMIMLGKYFDLVSNANPDENEFEIRVYKDDTLIGVVIDSEINY
jgi:hypothetical protein